MMLPGSCGFKIEQVYINNNHTVHASKSSVNADSNSSRDKISCCQARNIIGLILRDWEVDRTSWLDGLVQSRAWV
jgi:hypothetical protein